MLTAGATFIKFGVIPRYKPVTPSFTQISLNTDIIVLVSGPSKSKKINKINFKKNVLKLV